MLSTHAGIHVCTYEQLFASHTGYLQKLAQQFMTCMSDVFLNLNKAERSIQCSINLQANGVIHEIEPICVLDFYVHESCQRNGVGKAIFEVRCVTGNCLPHLS